MASRRSNLGGFLRAMRRGLRTPPTLHHATVEVTAGSAQLCRQFYTDVLCLTEIKSPVGGDRSIWFKEGIHLYWKSPSVFVDVLPQSDEPPASHIALCVGENYDRVIDVCKRWNLFITDGTDYWGSRRCFIRDPANNRIELMERVPE